MRIPDEPEWPKTRLEQMIASHSPWWVDFVGGFHDGSRHLIPVKDLHDSPFCCAGDGQAYQHYLWRSGTRIYDYAGPCAELPHLPHINPGNGMGRS